MYIDHHGSMETMPMNDPMIMIWFSYIYAIMLSRIGKVDTKAEFIHNKNLIERLQMLPHPLSLLLISELCVDVECLQTNDM